MPGGTKSSSCGSRGGARPAALSSRQLRAAKAAAILGRRVPASTARGTTGRGRSGRPLAGGRTGAGGERGAPWRTGRQGAKGKGREKREALGAGRYERDLGWRCGKGTVRRGEWGEGIGRGYRESGYGDKVRGIWGRGLRRVCEIWGRTFGGQDRRAGLVRALSSSHPASSQYPPVPIPSSRRSSHSSLPGHVQRTGPNHWQSTYSHTGEDSGDPSTPWMPHIPPQYHTVPVLGLARLPLRWEQSGL